MKTYHVVLTVKAANGTQAFEVPAESREDALRRFKADPGAYDIVDTEVEVTSLSDPRLEDVYEADGPAGGTAGPSKGEGGKR